LTRLNADGLSGNVAASLGLPASRPLGQEEMDGMRRRLGDVPDAVMVGRVAHLKWLLWRWYVSYGVRVVHADLSSAASDDGLFFLCLVGGDYSGRLLGMKIPAFVAGVRVRDGVNALAMVGKTLDKLNARYGWTLIPRNTTVAGRKAIVLESTRMGFYRTLAAAGMKVTLVDDGGWLVFSSSTATLESMLARPADTGSVDRWRVEIGKERAATFFWTDLAATGQSLRNAIAVSMMVVSATRSAEEAEAIRQELGTARLWVDRLAPLGTASVWIRAEENGTKAAVRLGDVKRNLAPASP
jgi:hypothetical protein